MTRTDRVVGLSAGIEAATGLALIAAPDLVARLLLGDEPAGVGIAVARGFGMALLALAVAVWPARDRPSARSAARGMLLYNALLALYLTWLGTARHMGGPLLWPAAVLHGVVAALLAQRSPDAS